MVTCNHIWKYRNRMLEKDKVESKRICKKCGKEEIKILTKGVK